MPHRNSIELSAIADQLSALADGLRRGDGQVRQEIEHRTGDELRKCYLDIAKQTYANRRKREAILGNADLLGEPAWDILLDLYVAQAEAHEVSVSSACIGSASPATTGLRWLGVLQEEGLVERVNDPVDQRRVLVKLSALGVDRMERYFANVDCKASESQTCELTAEQIPMGSVNAQYS